MIEQSLKSEDGPVPRAASAPTGEVFEARNLTLEAALNMIRSLINRARHENPPGANFIPE
jgi:hypothetical protein